jgi:hypothetical protein
VLDQGWDVGDSTLPVDDTRQLLERAEVGGRLRLSQHGSLEPSRIGFAHQREQVLHLDVGIPTSS